MQLNIRSFWSSVFSCLSLWFDPTFHTVGWTNRISHVSFYFLHNRKKSVNKLVIVAALFREQTINPKQSHFHAAWSDHWWIASCSNFNFKLDSSLPKCPTVIVVTSFCCCSAYEFNMWYKIMKVELLFVALCFFVNRMLRALEQYMLLPWRKKKKVSNGKCIGWWSAVDRYFIQE